MKGSRFFCLLLATFSIAAWSAEPLSIKGRQLGQSATTACEGSTTGILDGDKSLRVLQQAYPNLQPSRSTDCKLAISTFAGQTVDGEMILLFVDDRLIQIKFDMKPMDWGSAGDFYSAVEQSYGKTTPFQRTKLGLTTRTWRNGSQVLVLTRPSRSKSEYMDIEVILRDEPAWAAWYKNHTDNRAAISKADAAKRVNDTK